MRVCLFVLLLLGSSCGGSRLRPAGQMVIPIEPIMIPEPIVAPEPVVIPEPLVASKPVLSPPPAPFVVIPEDSSPLFRGVRPTSSVEKANPSTDKRSAPQKAEERLGPIPVVGQARPEEEEDNDGDDHHIATNKNDHSDARGGPWTPRFRVIFKKAGMDLDAAVNVVRVKGHKGPHPEEYHQEVWRTLNSATLQCASTTECKTALTAALLKLGKQISTPGTRLNHLVTHPALR
jgi:hypothetical protein